MIPVFFLLEYLQGEIITEHYVFIRGLHVNKEKLVFNFEERKGYSSSYMKVMISRAGVFIREWNSYIPLQSEILLHTNAFTLMVVKRTRWIYDFHRDQPRLVKFWVLYLSSNIHNQKRNKIIPIEWIEIRGIRVYFQFINSSEKISSCLNNFLNSDQNYLIQKVDFSNQKYFFFSMNQVKIIWVDSICFYCLKKHSICNEVAIQFNNKFQFCSEIEYLDVSKLSYCFENNNFASRFSYLKKMQPHFCSCEKKSVAAETSSREHNKQISYRVW